jgi:hypothetical protein
MEHIYALREDGAAYAIDASNPNSWPYGEHLYSNGLWNRIKVTPEGIFAIDSYGRHYFSAEGVATGWQEIGWVHNTTPDAPQPNLQIDSWGKLKNGYVKWK